MYIFHLLLATLTGHTHACHEAMVLGCNNYAECPKEASACFWSSTLSQGQCVFLLSVFLLIPPFSVSPGPNRRQMCKICSRFASGSKRLLPHRLFSRQRILSCFSDSSWN